MLVFPSLGAPIFQNISSHLSLNHEGRWGTTDDFAISFLHFPLFSNALWDLPNSRPVHSLILSSHLFLVCLVFQNISSHLFLNHEGRWGTTDDFAISFLHFPLFSTTLWDLPNSRLVHSLILSSHLFFVCLVFFPLSL